MASELAEVERFIQLAEIELCRKICLYRGS
jgi:hypothetical protein